MKNKVFFFAFLFLLCCSSSSTFAQSDMVDVESMQVGLWPDRSPQVLAPGRKVCPLFGVKKMGTAKNMEWRIQPLFFFVSPNVGLKKYWGKSKKGLHFSTSHQISYPSIYLNVIARAGAGGVLPENSEIPPMISMKNEFLLGLSSQGNHLTLRGGIATAFKLGSAEKRFPDIDYPFFYSRTLALNHSPNVYMGINFNKNILEQLNIEADFAAFSVGNSTNAFVYESQLIFFWKKSDRFGIKAGAAAAHGRYPYGKVFQLLPVVDFVFGFGKKKEIKE